MIAQLRSEWARGRGRPVEKYTGAVVVVLGVLMPIIMLLVSSRNPTIRAGALETLAFPASVRAGNTMAQLLGPLWAAALGANIVGAEYQYGTWPLLLVRASSRLRLLLVKIVTAAVRIVAMTIVGITIFVATGAGLRLAFGLPVVNGAWTIGPLLVSFVGVGGSMAFAAMIGFTITVVSRSVVFGMLTGVLALPLFAAIRFEETAAWLPNVHLENLQSRLLTGQPSPFLLQRLAFAMSGRASAAILAGELLALIAIAYVVFRRQEIVY